MAVHLWPGGKRKNWVHVPAQGSRLSTVHIPVTDNDNGKTQVITFSPVMSALRKMPRHRRLPDGGVVMMSRGRAVEKSQHRLQLLHWRFGPYQVCYLNPVTKVADKCDFCAES